MTAVLLVAALAAEPAPEATAPRSAAYRQALPDGSVIDWLGGSIQVTGLARIVYDIERSHIKARLTGLKAQGNGREKLMDLLDGLQLDGASRFGDDPERVRMARLKLQSLKSQGQGKDQPGWLTAKMELPLWGAGGVLEWVLDAGVARDGEALAASGQAVQPDGKDAPAAAEADNGRRAPTGLWVDARHLAGDAAPAPALLPRIVDENGRVLHSIETVEPSAARAAGLLAYAVGAPPASTRDAAPPSSDPPPREGVSPLRVTAVAAGGPSRSDIVVSVADGDRIELAARQGEFLAQCRVVVLMPPPPKPKVEVVVPRKRQSPADPTTPG